MIPNANIRFEDWEAEQMKDPEFRAAAEKLESEYQTARHQLLQEYATRLKVVITQEGPFYVSECPELGVSSFGHNEKEARENLADAIEVYLSTLEELEPRYQTAHDVHQNGHVHDSVNEEAAEQIKKIVQCP